MSKRIKQLDNQLKFLKIATMISTIVLTFLGLYLLTHENFVFLLPATYGVVVSLLVFNVINSYQRLKKMEEKDIDMEK